MGNQPSSGETANGTVKPIGRFMRTTGLLGLNKAELDERCKPSGLYPSCHWEDKAIRRLIGDGKLAARLRGTENRTSPTDRECPICFLQYREVNTTKCCSAYICTECFLQVRPQKAKSHSCPFCNHNKFGVGVAQTMNAEAMLAREETEQRFIEAKIRERARNAETDKEFGSSLQNYERIATLRARSSSLSEEQNAESIPEAVLRESFAMTPEERRMIEDEMRAQHSHPLSLRLAAEAEERRLHNEQEYLRNNPSHGVDRGRSRRSRGSERRNWNQIVEAFERGGHGEVNSLDDLVVLEAAMILSMEEESRRRSSGTNVTSATGSEAFDANRHANEGFPLVRSILSGRQPDPLTGGSASGEQNEQLRSLANSLYARRFPRNSLIRSAYAGGGTDNSNAALDTAGLMMRGITEDDQLAMAIAASLQDQRQQQQQQQQQEGEENSGGDTSNSELENEEGEEDVARAAVAEFTQSAANDEERVVEQETQAAVSAPPETTGSEETPTVPKTPTRETESGESVSLPDGADAATDDPPTGSFPVSSALNNDDAGGLR